MTRLLYKIITKKGDKLIRKLKKDAIDCKRVQCRVLLAAIKRGLNTKIGKKYHFDKIKDISTFKKFVPMLDSDAYKQYFDLVVQGNKRIITNKKIIKFAISSGSTGKVKYIPITKSFDKIYSDFSFVTAFSTIRKYYKKRNRTVSFGKGTLLINFSSLTRLSSTPLGPISASCIEKNKRLLPLLCASPMESYYAHSNFDTMYLHVLFALKERKLSWIGAPFSTHICLFIDCLLRNKDKLINDIAKGNINHSIAIPNETRKTIVNRLKPDPERAKQIKNEFSRGLENLLVRIWPKLLFVYSLPSDRFETDLLTIKKLFGNDLPIHFGVYGATESMFGVAIQPNKRQYLLIPSGGFYEFVDTETNDYSHTKNLFELEKGKSYEIVLTNLSGLYRYKICDVIKVVDFYGFSPVIEFQYRRNIIGNIATEKVTIKQTDAVIFELARVCGLDLRGYTVSTDARKYTIFLQLRDKPKKIQKKEYESFFDDKLSEMNIIYKQNLKSKILKRCEVRILNDNFYNKYHKYIVDLQILGQDKIPKKIVDEKVKKLFYENSK